MHKNVSEYINPFELLSHITIRNSGHIYVYMLDYSFSNIKRILCKQNVKCFCKRAKVCPYYCIEPYFKSIFQYVKLLKKKENRISHGLRVLLICHIKIILK